jgi:hypothetical protein
MTRLQWLRTRRNNRCPNHGGHISDSLIKTTAYCSVCNKVWIFRRNTDTWKWVWWYENPKKTIKLDKELGQRQKSNEPPMDE